MPMLGVHKHSHLTPNCGAAAVNRYEPIPNDTTIYNKVDFNRG